MPSSQPGPQGKLIMDITEHQLGTGVVLEPQGRIDSSTSKSFEERLMQALDRGPTAVIVDLSNVEYVSSAGLRVLLVAAKKIKSAGNQLILCGLSSHIREVFDISGFSAIFVIVGGLDDAKQKAGL
ncbi:STAS domain-containing protein [Fodinicurvata sp. EGI_FJ10296]|uniref:STAS domain-containing protein n=1 Tax=Fodinicurvata sp. EGI_FJ10296 TaxID=3231908 RepID=UPI003456E1E2